MRQNFPGNDDKIYIHVISSDWTFKPCLIFRFTVSDFELWSNNQKIENFISQKNTAWHSFGQYFGNKDV